MDRSGAISRRRLGSLGAALAATFLVPATATAHAVVVEASPGVNATVKASGFPVRITYNSRIDHRRSKLLLIDRDGKETEIPHRTDVPADQMQGAAGMLAPGKYKLRWQVLAVDGHITRGDIPITVAP